MTLFITETAVPVDLVFHSHAPPDPVVYLQYQRQFLLTVIFSLIFEVIKP